LFEWANDPETRNNAINTKPISWEEHEKWFLEKHNNPHTSMFIARFNELPIGQIRFDEVNDFMDLTYSVAPSHRGVGLGGQIVEKAIGVLREFVSTSKKIRAFVLEENVSSVKIFRKMGFTECPVAIKDGRRFYQFHYSLS
jgi:RimJ/RimL family protein N-acetyltransferase